MSDFGEALAFYADRQSDEIKRTGLNVQYSVRQKNKEEILTVNVEMALMAQGATTPDWKNKIYLQLTQSELTSFCEVLFGLRRQAEFSFHGANRNKGLKIFNNNAKGVLLVISEAGKTMQHMLNHSQRIELGVFIIRRQAMAWKITVSDVLAVMRQSVAISRITDSSSQG
ncbi:hypothetical protein ACI0X9_004180 [Cronobacter turicensis]